MKVVRSASGKDMLVVSAKEWSAIGTELGWLKAAERVQVDGKWYDEDERGNLIEIDVPAQRASASPKSKSFPGMDITFTEGETYANWYGEYRVEKINNDGTMDIRYLQAFQPQVMAGDVKRYPMLSQAETISKARRERTIDIERRLNLNRIREFSGSRDFFTLGYIAANGYISAEIGPKFHERFPAVYKDVTGEDPAVHLDRGYHLSPNDARWSYTLRVHLPVPEPDIANTLSLPQHHMRGEGIEINDNAFVWGLLKSGFRLGKNTENIASIAAAVPERERESFASGASA